MQTVIPAASAGVGYLIGGGFGAQVGWMVGSYFASSTEKGVEKQKIGETYVATSAFGVAINQIIGTERVSGNTIWSTEKVFHPGKSASGGGKGGSKKTEEEVQSYYTVSRAIAICQGPIVGIRRVWENDKLVVGPGQKLPGTLFLGTNDQLPSSVMTAHLGSDIPAFRGIAYMVIDNEYLGQNGVLPNYSFEVVYGGL